MYLTKEKIKEARASLEMSQEDFGNILGMSGSSVSMLERGETSPITVEKDDSNYLSWKAVLMGNKDQIKNLPNPIAAWLKLMRKRNKLTIEQLSTKSSVSDYEIRSIERGELPRSRKSIEQLEMTFGEKSPEIKKNKLEDNFIPNVGGLEDFNPHNINDRPICSGIYVFYDISDRPIYVGESKNIRNRIKQHEEKFWFKQPIVEYAAYIKIDDEKLRKGIEQILINFLRSNAVLNKQHVNRS